MKKLILGFAALSLLMAGCGDDNNENRNQNNSHWIHLDPNTIRPGRGTESTLLSMQSDLNGFRVWATSATTAAGWYDGMNGIYHKYQSSAWNFIPEKQWPTDAAEYPLDFTAFYPGVAAQLAIDSTLHTVRVTISAPTVVANQTDFLRAQATAVAKPSSGNLAMTFHHVMSKVNFGMVLGAGFNAQVQGLGIRDVSNVGTVLLTGDTPGWTGFSGQFTGDYTYFGTLYDNATGNTVVLDNETFIGDGTTIPFYTATTVPKAVDANMFLVPQVVSGRTWGGVDAPTALPTAAESYIVMIYRLDNNGADMAGLAEAQDHPDFATSALSTVQNYPPASPLFVKVGYPFVLSWQSGKGYTYNIAMNDDTNTTGGYLLDNYYYDESGNRTDLRIDAVTPGVDAPDPIFGDGSIHLIPDVTDWDEETGSIR